MSTCKIQKERNSKKGWVSKKGRVKRKTKSLHPYLLSIYRNLLNKFTLNVNKESQKWIMKEECHACPMLLHGEHFHVTDQGEKIQGRVQMVPTFRSQRKSGIHSPQDSMIKKQVSTQNSILGLYMVGYVHNHIMTHRDTHGDEERGGERRRVEMCTTLLIIFSPALSLSHTILCTHTSLDEPPNSLQPHLHWTIHGALLEEWDSILLFYWLSKL